MTSISLLLQKKPIIGAVSSATGGAAIFIDWISPIVSFLAALAGLTVGVLTAYLKWMEVKDRKNKK